MTEGEMVGWHHRLNGHEFEQDLGVGDGQGHVLQSMGSQRVGHDRATELNSTSNAGGMGSIPGQGTKIPHSSKCIKKKKDPENKNHF